MLAGHGGPRGRMGWGHDRTGLELPRRDRGGDHALSCRQHRSDHACDSALGDRLLLRAAGGAVVEGAMAAPRRLAGCSRAGLLFLRRVLRFLQHRDVLHDRGARQPRAGDIAAAHHGGRCNTRHRAADETENDRGLHCGARGRCRACNGIVGRAAGSLARRTDHDRSCLVHGVLQCLVSPPHPAIERAWLPPSAWGPAPRPWSWSAC